MASRFEAEKFNCKNDYGLWKMKMKALLIQQGLAAALNPLDPKAKGKETLDEKAQMKHEEMIQKAHSAVILCLGDKVLREVQNEKTAAEILAKLDEVYLAKSLANRLYMKRRLYSYSFVDERSIIEQMEDFNKTIDDLEAVDVKISDEDKTILVLNALRSSYDQMRDAILYGRDKQISLSEVTAALMSKELQKGAVQRAETQPESLNIKKFVKKKFKKKSEDSKADSGGVKETRSCHWCKKPGHIKKDCFAWKKKQAMEKGSSSNVVSNEEQESPEALNVVDITDEGSWIMDSGCSFHMSPHVEWFQSMKPITGTVLLGNDQVCHIKGIGSIKLRMHDGAVRVLTDVRFVPQVKRNLISLGTLELKGYSFTSSGGRMEVHKGSAVKMVAKRVRSLYYLDATVILGEANVAVAPDLRLWHLRMGHPAEGSLKQLMKRGSINGDAGQKLDPCEFCIRGKAKKLPFPAGKHQSISPLDYAHSDLWGPAPVNSLGGGRYYMSIIDDYSRKACVYILKEKSDAFSVFKNWCKEVEIEKGCSLKCLRTDNGLEYLSKEFDVFCKEKGIKRHRTVPANPQQNGIAERLNRTLLERVRCMLLSSGLEKKFWGEAVSTAAHLINKCPSSSINGDIPDERWYGGQADYSRLRPFGCRAFAHTKDSKLDPRALRCVMLGYQKGVKGYRLWCLEPGNHKVVVSRDVVFLEEQMPCFKSDQSFAEVSELMGDGLEVEPDGADSDENVAADGTMHGPDVGSEQQNEDLTDYLLARDRTRRVGRKLPARYADSEMLSFALNVAEQIEYSEPATYSEAVGGPEKEQWVRAMKEEFDSLIRNKTWILVDKVMMRRVISCKWVYKKKIETADQEQIRFKARLVARGFTQEEGVDFNEVFSPVVKHTSIRMLLALVAQRNWFLEQLDVKTAFLNGELEETIYMAQPKGFEVPGSEDKVCLLKKSIYGLKQSSRQWYKKFGESMSRHGFVKSRYDNCVYVRRKKGSADVYLLLYVDDMLVAGPDFGEIRKVKEQLKADFEMKDLGEARRILGMDIIRDKKNGKLWLFQSDYINKILKKFNIDNMKPTGTPLAQHFKLSCDQRPKSEEERLEMSLIPYSNIVGSIMYMMICTRPDLGYAISATSRYMTDHGREHWSALKWTLRYLKGAGNLGILYEHKSGREGDALLGFCDSDYATNLDTRRSQTGYVFTLYGSAICWKSGLQDVVALSTTEAEYMALTSAVKESKWLNGLASDFGISQQAITVHCDNNGAICLAKHQMFHERCKHIDVRLHFIRDEVESGQVKVEKIDTAHNPSDMLTKPLNKGKFDYCLKLLNLVLVPVAGGAE